MLNDVISLRKTAGSGRKAACQSRNGTNLSSMAPSLSASKTRRCFIALVVELLSFRLSFFFCNYNASETRNEDAFKSSEYISLRRKINGGWSIDGARWNRRRSIGFVEFQRVNVLRLLIDDSHSRTGRFIKKNERSYFSSSPVRRAVSFLFPFQRWLDCEKS